MAGLNAIGKRLEHYESQVESWKVPHAEVMREYDSADALGEEADFGVYLYNRLASFQARTFEEAKSHYEGYLYWHRQTLRLLRAIEESEKRGYSVEGADELRSAYRTVSFLADKIEGRVVALDSFLNGEGITDTEFLAQL